MASNINQQYISTLKTIKNILSELFSLCKKKQESILEQDWRLLLEISERQQSINNDFDIILNKLLNFTHFNNEKEANEVLKIKNSIKEKINEYKELETLNKKLLKDAFYAAKQKAEKFFDSAYLDDTYTKDFKKDVTIWGNNPIMLDKTI